MPEVDYELRSPAAWITLDRPETLNSLTPDLLTEFEGALNRAEADDGARSVVVTGAGRAFCAGADLKGAQADLEGVGDSGEVDGVREHVAFLTQVNKVFRRLEMSPKPTIAAVNGYALAGGLELVLCCDLVVAVRGAEIGDAHANYGLIPGGGASVRLPRKIGLTRAKHLLYTGAFLSAEKLEEWGLVNEVVDDDGLVEAVQVLVDVLAKKSPLGIQRMKQLVEDGLGQSIDAAVRNEIVASEAHMRSHDMAEGLEAFASKRQPVFTGS